MAIPQRTIQVLLLGLIGLALGQAEQPKKARPVDDVSQELQTADRPAAATIERIMDQAVRNIAARYNLNDVQTEATDKLMKREVHRFLKEHEDKVWPAIRDLLTASLGTKPPDSKDKVMEMGRAARPLSKLAREAIFRANEEWRLFLTAEQKKVHDYDLGEMEKTFEQIDKNFGAWEAGEPPPGGIFPQPKLTGKDPPRPPKPAPGRLPEPEIEIFDPNSIFEALVEEFIKEYELEESQVTSARSILEEFKVKANDFREANKLEFIKNAVQRQEAEAKRDLEAIKQAAAEHKKLLQPIYALCEEMDGRLKHLLTTVQKDRHAERQRTATSSAAPQPDKEPPKEKTDAAKKPDAPEPQSKAGGEGG